MLVTSDETTKDLYQVADFLLSTSIYLIEKVSKDGGLDKLYRCSLQYLRMNAVESVLSATIPLPVVEWLMTNDAIFRLSTMVSGVNVG